MCAVKKKKKREGGIEAHVKPFIKSSFQVAVVICFCLGNGHFACTFQCRLLFERQNSCSYNYDERESTH